MFDGVRGLNAENTRLFKPGRSPPSIASLAKLDNTVRYGETTRREPDSGLEASLLFCHDCLAHLDDGSTLLNGLVDEMLDLMPIELYLQGNGQMFE